MVAATATGVAVASRLLKRKQLAGTKKVNNIDNQKNNIQLTITRRDFSIGYNKYLDGELYPDNPIVQNYIKLAQVNAVLVESKWFNNLIIFCIVMAAVIVGVQSYTEDAEEDFNPYLISAITMFDTTILSIFTAEVAFKVLAEGMGPWRYFSGAEYAWNNFDVIIVVLCYLPLGGNASSARLLRLFRLMRVAKIVRKVPQLQMIVMGLVGGMKSIVYIMILLFLVFYLYAIAGVIFFGLADPWHYGTLWKALVTLFRCSTMEDWTEVMYINIYGCDSYPNIYVTGNATALWGKAMDEEFFCTAPKEQPILSILFHVSFIIISALVMMSLFVGAVTMSMTESMDHMKLEAEEGMKMKRLEKGRKMAEQLKNQESGDMSAESVESSKGKISEDISSEKSQQSSKRNQKENNKRAREQRRLQQLMKKAWTGMDMTDDIEDEVLYKSALKQNYARLALFCRRIAESTQFQNFITVVILLAGIVVGLQTAQDYMTDVENQFVERLDDVILYVFMAECAIKIIAEEFEPWMYFTDGWNIFDFLIVMASQPYTEGGGEIFTMFRLLRLLRVLKLVKALPQLQVIVTALIMGLNSIAFIAIIISIFFYFFAIIGMILFKDNDPWHFGTLHITMFTLFRCATLEDWTDVMYTNMYGCDQYGYDEWPDLCLLPSKQWIASVAYFVVFVTIGALVLFSLFIGVVTTSMEEATTEMKKNKEVNEKVERLQDEYNLSDSCVQMYKLVFKNFDMDGSGTIEEEELEIGLNLIGKRPSDDELKELIEQVDKDHSGEIDFSEFLEFMVLRKKMALERGAKLTSKTKRTSIFKRGSISRRLTSARRSMSLSKRRSVSESSRDRSGNRKVVPVDSLYIEEPEFEVLNAIAQGASRQSTPSHTPKTVYVEERNVQEAGETSRERPNSAKKAAKKYEY